MYFFKNRRIGFRQSGLNRILRDLAILRVNYGYRNEGSPHAVSATKLQRTRYAFQRYIMSTLQCVPPLGGVQQGRDVKNKLLYFCTPISRER